MAEPGRISIVVSVGAGVELRGFGTTCTSAVPRTVAPPTVATPVTMCRPRWLAEHRAPMHEPSLRRTEPDVPLNAMEKLVLPVTSPMRLPSAS